MRVTGQTWKVYLLSPAPPNPDEMAVLDPDASGPVFGDVRPRSTSDDVPSRCGLTLAAPLALVQ